MKNCKKCGNEFEEQKGLINYCSLACRNSREQTELSNEKRRLKLTGVKISKKIESDGLCSYGCGNIGQYELRNNKKCCSDSYNKCSANRAKNSEKLKLSYKNGNRPSHKECFGNSSGWRRGKTFLSDNRIKSKYTKEEIFCENSPKHRGRLKELIIKENIIEYKCSGENCICVDKWLGKPITLELDHVNGDGSDNRLENLRFLCPNCHSQTDTFRRNGLNKLTKIKLTDEQYILAIKSTENIKQTLLLLNLNTTGGNYFRVLKLMKKYNLTYPIK
jgi:Zn finger protein HypA/HybF involved in hydrogenase expression